MLTASLLFNLVLWSLSLACHARLQSGWQRRRKWFPTRTMQQIMQAGRAVPPMAGLVLSTVLAGAEGVVGWVACASLSGVMIASADAWYAQTSRQIRAESGSRKT